MHVLTGTLRAYPWGSRTAIAELRGEPSPSERPEAEIWFGAHPTGSSLIEDTPLVDLIEADPEFELGARVCSTYGNRLPFLLKLLAAGEPLSLQAHPSKAQAEEGFARENANGPELNAPNRNYKDDNHKPELIVALTPFEAMAGFRPISKTVELFDALNSPALDHYRPMLEGSDEDVLRSIFTTWIGAPVATRNQLIDALITAAKAVVAKAESKEASYAEWIVDTLRNIINLNDRYPGDVGVLGALLLNKVNLEPGEALYLDAGQLHAYVHGLGVEIMANSDNVLRGGLTSKHVDVPELARVLRFVTNDDPRVVSEADSTLPEQGTHYPVPIDEFDISRYEVSGPVAVDHDGPQIILATKGTLQAQLEGKDHKEPLSISQGHAIWVPAGDPTVHIAPAGDEPVEFFIARV
ncbi:MAG: mannose-6-phosphate isomerase, class I [Corynebacterium sp.]|nr:mannose-6-phosphate isomerase, class I [Corynebacterium sp.]